MKERTSKMFASKVSKVLKRTAGRTDVDETPLDIRVTGAFVGDSERKSIRARLGRRLARFGPRIGRVTVRFEDQNGPKGGDDITCRIRVGFQGHPDVFAEKTSDDVMDAFAKCAKAVADAMKHAVDRAHVVIPHERAANKTPVARAPRTRRAAAMEGSTIGRRVGRSRENLLITAARPEKKRRDVLVDTSLPNVSATDRRVGGNSTAARNTRLDTDRASFALEDSRTTPSRKSTRKSANRVKGDNALTLRARVAAHSPARARNAAGKRK